MASKKSNFFFYLFLFLIAGIYLFLRLYHLPEFIGFRLDQGIHLLETKTMIDNHELRLIGPMVTSKSLDGRNFFIGANYYYVLALIGIISHWNPFIITVLFIFIELFSYLFFTLFIKKTTNSFLALLSFLFISLSSYLVIHSRFFWNPHLLIPLSIFCLISLFNFFQKNKFIYLFISALLWGFAFSCHYSAIFWVIFFLYFLLKSKKIFNLKSYFFIILGFLIGDLPFFIFELRHNFYNLTTMFYIFTHSSQSSEVTSHYFVFPLLIFFLYFLSLCFSKIKQPVFQKTIPFLFYFIVLLIQFKIFDHYQALDYISGWDYSTQNQVADLISQNCPQNFNLAATMQGDTRFYDLRYLLYFRNCHPNTVENYPSSDILFLVAPNNRPPQSETVWEVNSLKPFTIINQITLNSDLIFYRLEKIKNLN